MSMPFPTENWKRPKDEVSVLIKRCDITQKNWQGAQTNIKSIIELLEVALCPISSSNCLNTRQNPGLSMNVALNYGGRMEIVRAARILGDRIAAGDAKRSCDRGTFASYLLQQDSRSDLLIRPSGELRISNFLLWQLAYAEFYFSDINWPDFGKKEFYHAMIDFQQRERRYGGI